MKARKSRQDKNRKAALSNLRKYKIAIIGYGSQGQAQALNLRDSGITPIIGLQPRSKSRRQAQGDGFTVTTPARTCADADIVAILVPDHKHKELFEYDLYNAIKPGQIFIFAHGLSVHFGLVSQPDDVAFALVAPHGPGIRLREKYIQGRGLTAFIGKTDKSPSSCLKPVKAYADAIGCPPGNLIKTCFADEAIGDIFGEQAVLCGGLSGLLKAGFDTLVKAGLSPENAYLECIHQIDLIVDLIKKYGIDGMYDRISTTAAFGSVQSESKIINRQSRLAMAGMLADIKSGKFVINLMKDYKNNFAAHKTQRRKQKSDKLNKIARRFSKKLDT